MFHTYKLLENENQELDFNQQIKDVTDSEMYSKIQLLQRSKDCLSNIKTNKLML